MVGKNISHYRILEKLGKGGMGVVYRAEDTRLQREVALKILARDLVVDPEFKKRFRREAETAGLLNHPNIISIHEIGDYQGRTYLVMECVERTLSGVIEDFKQTRDSTEKFRDIVNIGLQVCLGLEKAHQQGIIHRDIKPGNILIDRDGKVKISDFGLAKWMDASRSSGSRPTGGTAAYVSPEQFGGKKLDHRTDIWSFGAVLYQVTTGEPPFKEEYMQALFYAILNEEPVPVSRFSPGIPPGLEKIVHKCLAKDPDQRYPSMSVIRKELMRVKQELTPAEKTNKVKRIKNFFHKFRKIFPPWK